MSCCNCSPRRLQPVVCCVPTNDAQEYNFENAGIAGIGVFDNETDFVVQFRTVVSDSAGLTITLNAPNKEIHFTIDEAAIIAAIPDATTAVKGIGETSTDAEALAKASTAVFLTPSNLAALGSTTTFAGLTAYATSAQTITGTSTTLAVTPAGLAAAVALKGTTTFADAVARAGATPAFDGQFGAQIDTEQGYVSGSASVGDWNGLFTFGAINTMSDTTSLDLNGSTLTFSGGSFNLAGSTSNTWSGNTTFDNCLVTLDNTSTLDFGDAIIQIGGVQLLAETLIGADSGGNLAAIDISDFISTYDTQTGYTAFANGAVLRTCDTTTVTLPQLAQIVGTLIEDLKAVQLPAT